VGRRFYKNMPPDTSRRSALTLEGEDEGRGVDHRSREGAGPKMGFTLARKAVAAFMLDAIEQKKLFHKIVGIAK
jgi:hypothetical protein